MLWHVTQASPGSIVGPKVAGAIMLLVHTGVEVVEASAPAVPLAPLEVPLGLPMPPLEAPLVPAAPLDPAEPVLPEAPVVLQGACGIPALTQPANAAAAEAEGAGFPAGGIGATVDCMRVTQRAPTVSLGLDTDGAMRSA